MSVAREVSFRITFEGNTNDLEQANQSMDQLIGSAARADTGLNRVQTGLQQTSSSARSLSQNLSTASKRLKDISSKASKLGNQLSLGLTTPLTVAGTGIVKSGMEFQSKMSEVKAISMATEEEFERLNKKAREMGMTTKFSASESADALKYMSMAGWKSNQMIEALPGVMNLAASSGEDLGIVSDILTDSMTAFGLKASESSHFADVLAKASSSSNTNVALLGETFKYVAPVAGALGYSVEDTAIGIGLMANAGIKGSQAGTALRSTFSRLADTGNKEVVSSLKQLGISMTDSQGKIKPFKTLMDEMRTSFSHLSEAEQASYATTVFGREAMSGMLSIIRTSPEEYQKLTSGIYQADGAAKQMSETMMDNLKGQITLLNSSLQELGLQFYDIVAPSIETGVQKVQEAVTWFSNLDNETKKTIVKVGLFLAALGPGLKLFSFFTGGLSHVVTGINLFTKGFSAMKSLGVAGTFLKMKAGLVAFSSVALPVIAVIAGLVAVGYLLYKNWDTVKSKGIEFTNTLREKFAAFAPQVQTIFQNIGIIFNALSPIFFGVISGIGSILGDFVLKASDLIGNIIKIFSGLTDFLVGVFTGNWTQAWTGIKNIFSGIFGGVKTIFQGVINTIIGGINTVIKAVNGIKLPKWIPGIGGKHASIPEIPKFAKGVTNFQGGAAIVGEEGAELVHLPKGSNVIPHRKTMDMLNQPVSSKIIPFPSQAERNDRKRKQAIGKEVQPQGKEGFGTINQSVNLGKTFLDSKNTLSRDAFEQDAKYGNKNNKVIMFNPSIHVENNGSETSMTEEKLKRMMRELFEELIEEEDAIV